MNIWMHRVRPIFKHLFKPQQVIIALYCFVNNYNNNMTSPLKSICKHNTRYTLTLPKDISNQYKMVTTHMIDGIYQGFINSSYQRDGFGILQTENYQTYVGFFKYNKMHGLGLIIFPDGCIIYGNFFQGRLEGIALTDNLREMQIGTYKQQGMVGIGFEYNYQSQTWKMNKYHRYVPIDTLNQESMTDPEGIPQIFGVQPLILQHYIRFKTKQFFYNENEKEENMIYSSAEDLNTVYYHQISPSLDFYGAIIQSKYEGLGLIYDSKAKMVLETGMYSKGLLHGYGMKTSSTNSLQTKGRFIKGKKDGIFMEVMGDITKFVKFSGEQKYSEQKRQQNESSYQKQQRIYNFREKDFLSVRHGIEFEKLKSVFQTREYKVWKLQLLNQGKKQKESSPSKGKDYKQNARIPATNPNKLANIHAFQKSSLFIMKDKISSFGSKKKGSFNSKNEKKMSMKIIETEQSLLNSNRSKFEEHSQDEIGVEENPLKSHPNHSQHKKFSFKK